MSRLGISFMLAIGFVLALVLFLGTTASYSDTQDINTECIQGSVGQPDFDLASEISPLSTLDNAPIIQLLTQGITNDSTMQVAARCASNETKCAAACCPAGWICCPRAQGPDYCSNKGSCR